jgi:hypothetical protein
MSGGAGCHMLKLKFLAFSIQGLPMVLVARPSQFTDLTLH